MSAEILYIPQILYIQHIIYKGFIVIYSYSDGNTLEHEWS